MKKFNYQKILFIAPLIVIASLTVGFSSWFIIVSNQEAVPTIESYNIKFYVNDSLEKEYTGLDGNSSFDFPFVDVTGYSLANWSLTNAKNDAIKYDIKASLSDVLTNYNGTDTTLRFDANLTINKYTVRFDSMGGSSVSSQEINYNEVATRPADPTKADYTFDNWYIDMGYSSIFNFSTKITGDITLYAKWLIN